MVCAVAKNSNPKVTVMEIDPQGSNITKIPIGGKWVYNIRSNTIGYGMEPLETVIEYLLR